MEERIGFKIKKNKLELVLPSFIKNRDLNDLNSMNEKIKYFKLFRKFKKHSKAMKEESVFTSESVKEEKYMYSIFEAYYLLLIDFMESGVFIFSKRKTNQIRKGRINWQRTINKSNLIISGESLIYESPYYMNNSILYNHPLTILYGIHLLEIEKATGIKMNLNSQYKKAIEDNKRAVYTREILDEYRSSMYSDRQRKVFKILESINDNSRKLNKTPSNRNLYYLENINDLWEHMLKQILEDQYHDFNRCFPEGSYNLNIKNYNSIRSGLRMIPDIVKEYNDKLYIIDAKNYQPLINNTVPGTADINKQILYRYFLSKEFNKNNKYVLKDIKNIFLLPNELEGEIIRKIGTHKLSNVDSTIADIYLYQVDYDSIVEAYISNENKINILILDKLEC